MEINFNLSVVLICFDFRCSHDHFRAMDWRNFTPKYSDCADAYSLLQSAQVNKKKILLLVIIYHYNPHFLKSWDD